MTDTERARYFAGQIVVRYGQAAGSESVQRVSGGILRSPAAARELLDRPCPASRRSGQRQSGHIPAAQTPMKILQCVGDIDPALGGSVEAARQLSHALHRLGHRPELVTLRRPQRGMDPPPGKARYIARARRRHAIFIVHVLRLGGRPWFRASMPSSSTASGGTRASAPGWRCSGANSRISFSRTACWIPTLKRLPVEACAERSLLAGGGIARGPGCPWCPVHLRRRAPARPRDLPSLRMPGARRGLGDCQADRRSRWHSRKHFWMHTRNLP